MSHFRTIGTDGILESVFRKKVKLSELSSPQSKSALRLPNLQDLSNTYTILDSKDQTRYEIGVNPAKEIDRASMDYSSNILAHIDNRFQSPNNKLTVLYTYSNDFQKLTEAFKLNSPFFPSMENKKKYVRKHLVPYKIEKNQMPGIGSYDIERGLSLIKRRPKEIIIFKKPNKQRLAPLSIDFSAPPLKPHILFPLSSRNANQGSPKWSHEFEKNVDSEISNTKVMLPKNESATNLVTKFSHFKSISNLCGAENSIERNVSLMNERFVEVRRQIQRLKVDIHKKQGF